MELFATDGHDAGGCERVTGKSGMRPVESAIRRVINLRIKGASIYWLPESVDAILLLRSFYKSGRWNCLQRMAMTPGGCERVTGKSEMRPSGPTVGLPVGRFCPDDSCAARSRRPDDTTRLGSPKLI